MQAKSTDDGETIYVSPADGDKGSKGPFLVAYHTSEGAERYGWFCTNCESVDNAMDAMGRIQCNRCGNFRKATEWDAAHE